MKWFTTTLYGRHRIEVKLLLSFNALSCRIKIPRAFFRVIKSEAFQCQNEKRKKNTTSAECELLCHKSQSHRFGSFKFDVKTHYFFSLVTKFHSWKLFETLFAEWSLPWLRDQSEKKCHEKIENRKIRSTRTMKEAFRDFSIWRKILMLFGLKIIQKILTTKKKSF